MAETLLAAVAWPYANGPLHLGHIAGAYLPADIFARYHRLRGDRVLMVSGSDQHGTPITVRAEQEGKTPAEVAAHYHDIFLTSWERLGISFDLFTRTGTENHAQVTHDIFLKLLEKGYVYHDVMQAPYCPKCTRFLPDRYVEGVCPYCQFEGARGDQCDECGRQLNPIDLIAPRCKICGSTPEMRETEHFYLKLTAFGQELERWLSSKSHWRANVLNLTLGTLKEGLKDRPITRDIEWGISVPVPGFERKRIYVWFEAVIGYLSAAKEWATSRGTPEAWRDFWQGGSKAYYFIGKDNIPFHTIIWPVMLMGYGGLNLPYDVPANEFLTLEARQLSTSRGWAVWLFDCLERFSPDAIRFYLAMNMPETGDADFSWPGFFRRNNDELVATYGNLVHRVLTITYRHYEGKVPSPGSLSAAERAILEKARVAFDQVGGQISACHFREGIKLAFGLAQEANRYLDEKAPWKTVRKDRASTATTLHTALTVINGLKLLLYPYLPFSSERLHALLGCAGSLQEQGWALRPLPAGQVLQQPEPLFAKLDEALLAQEPGAASHSVESST